LLLLLRLFLLLGGEIPGKSIRRNWIGVDCLFVFFGIRPEWIRPIRWEIAMKSVKRNNINIQLVCITIGRIA